MRPQSAKAFSALNEAAQSLMSIVESRMVGIIQTGEGDCAEMQSDVERAVIYHLGSGGQRIRARLALHSGLALGLWPDDAVTIAAAAELLHNASLIHDDLQDRDRSRRGVETVWSVFGDNVAICAGDLLLSAAYDALAAFGDPGVLASLIALVGARTLNAIRGQIADLKAMEHGIDMAAYEKIALAKSGALLSLPMELAFVASSQARWAAEAKRAAEAFALGYQIIDDLADIDAFAGLSGTPGSLNAVLVLKAAGHGNEAYEIARGLGRRHLSLAAAAAKTLPNGSGDLLRELSLRLAARL